MQEKEIYYPLTEMLDEIDTDPSLDAEAGALLVASFIRDLQAEAGTIYDEDLTKVIIDDKSNKGYVAKTLNLKNDEQGRRATVSVFAEEDAFGDAKKTAEVLAKVDPLVTGLQIVLDKKIPKYISFEYSGVDTIGNARAGKVEDLFVPEDEVEFADALEEVINNATSQVDEKTAFELASKVFEDKYSKGRKKIGTTMAYIEEEPGSVASVSVIALATHEDLKRIFQ